MPQRIIIEGDVVRVVEETEISVATIASIMPHLERRLPVNVGPLPLGTLYLAYDADGGRFSTLVERPPIVQTIRVHFKTNNGATEDVKRPRDAAGNASFKIALPYSLWSFSGTVSNKDYLSVDSASHWWSPKHVNNLKDPLYAAVLPNIFNGGSICWGGTSATGNGFDRLTTLVNEFLTTEFNDHLSPNYPAGYKSLSEWEKASAADANCWRNWDWKKLHTTSVERAIDATQPPTTYTFDFIIPTPPPTFTLEKAREWIRRIPDRDRSVMLAAIREEAK